MSVADRTAVNTARGADADTSPEFEFTFLRPTHQPRTLARPASSYLSRPTSPSPHPPSRATSPAPVPAIVPSASQQRPLGPKPLRQGAPRLGGLGLGGILAPEPAPRARPSSQPPAGRELVAPVPPLRAASPAPAPAPAPPALPTRPFLSPELAKPTIRSGTFALDAHAVPDPVSGGRRSRSLTPEGASGAPDGTDAAVEQEKGAEAAGADDGDEPEDDRETQQEHEWLQASPDVEHGSGGFAVVVDGDRVEDSPRTEPDTAVADVFEAPTSREQPDEAHTSELSHVETPLLGVAHQVDADDEEVEIPTSRRSEVVDDRFDATVSVVERLPAASPRLPPLTFELSTGNSAPDEAAASAPIVERPRSRLGDATDDLSADETSADVVILDGPTFSLDTASASSTGEAFDELDPVSGAHPPEESPPPLLAPTPGTEEHLSFVTPARPVAAAILARAGKSASSTEPHGAVEDGCDPASSPALSRSPSVAGSLASEYSTHDGTDDVEPPTALLPEEPAEQPALVPFEDADVSVEAVPTCEDDRRGAAAVYPSPPSSPETSGEADFPATPASPKPTLASLAQLPVIVPPSTPQPILPATSVPSERRSSQPSPSSPQRGSPVSSATFSPSFSSYEGLGLRVPSSLSRNKRASAVIPPASPPMSPEVVEQAVLAEPVPVLAPAPSALNTIEEPKDRVEVDADEAPAPQLPSFDEGLASPPISRDYAHALCIEPDSANDGDAELAVFTSADVVNAAVWEEGNDEFTPASSATNSPALSAHTAASDFGPDPDPDSERDADVPEAPLGEPVQRVLDDLAASASPAVPTAGDAALGSGVVDVGVAVAGALVMGGLAVGQSAWRGLAGWAWRSEAPPPAPVSVSIQDEPREEVAEVPGVAKVERELTRSGGKPESSVAATEWGEMEFDAPDGFLDEFRQAMEGVGEEQLAAEDQAAQDAAYIAALRQHDEALEGEPVQDGTSSSGESTPAPSVRTLVFPSAGGRRSRPSSIAGGSVRSNGGGLRPLTPADELAEGSGGELDELDRMLAPVWDARERQRGSLVPSTSGENSRHAFAAPPGLAGGVPVSRMLSPPASLLSQSPPSLTSSLSSRAATATKEQIPGSRSSRSLFKFGSSSKAPKPPKADKLKKAKHDTPPSLSPPVGSPRSATLLSSVDDDGTSAHGKSTATTPKSASRRRSFLFLGGNGGGGVPPVPSIESRIADTTYVHYGSAKPPRVARRESNASTASTAADLYASRDPVLIPGVPASPSAYAALLPAPAAGDTTADSPRRSSLRAEGESKLYRVRFANASRGLGLRSVAEDEAERGGEEVALKWIGVGRGRYGNLTIKESEEMDVLYESQVKTIKGKWRAFGSDQSRDWAGVRID